MDRIPPNDTMSVRDDPTSVWMLINGSAVANVSTLDAPLLRPFDGNTPPSGAADVTKAFAIKQIDIVTWVVDRYPYVEAATPIVVGNASDGWNANTTIHLPFNSTIDIIMTVANDSMDMASLPDLFRKYYMAYKMRQSGSELTFDLPDGPPHASPRS